MHTVSIYRKSYHVSRKEQPSNKNPKTACTSTNKTSIENKRLVGWLVGWSVGRTVGWLVGWLAGWSVSRSVGRTVGWLVRWVGGWLLSCLVA